MTLDAMTRNMLLTGDEAFTPKDAKRRYPPDIRLRPVHGDLQLEINLTDASLVGTVEWQLKQTDLRVTALFLDAVGLTFDKIESSVDEGFQYEYDGHRLKLIWAKDTQLDGEKLRLHWRVSTPSAGLYFVHSAADTGSDLISGCFTDHETERARYWLPCVDHPSAGSSLSLRLKGASEYEHLAFGIKSTEVVKDGYRVSTWDLEEPCPPYLLCFAVGRFTEYAVTSDCGRSLNVYSLDQVQDSECLSRYFNQTSNMMSWIQKRLGVKFPYPKYWQFTAPELGGAMENITLTGWDSSFFGGVSDSEELGWIVDIINLHEMAHSYFGDMVVIRDFSHAWLKEGWATYLETVWLDENVSPEAAQAFFYEDRLNYLVEVDTRYTRAIVHRRFEHSWHMYDRHLYQGAALRLNALRHKVGDDAFWRGVQSYLTTFAHKVAETADFRLALEQETGINLSQFFDDWFRRAGLPTVMISGFELQENGERSPLVLRQQACDREAFELSVEIGMRCEKSGWHFQWVDVTAQEQSISFSGIEKAVEFAIDPFGKSLFRLESSLSLSVWRTVLERSPYLGSRLQAVEFLLGDGGGRPSQFILDAYRREQFFNVRRCYVSLLGTCIDGNATSMLIECLRTETDPRVLSLIASKLQGRHLTEEQLVNVRAKLNGGGGRTLSALLKVIAFQDRAEDLALCQGFIEDETRHPVIRMGSLEALGLFTDRRAFDYVLENYGAFHDVVYLKNVRHAALVAAAGKHGRSEREIAHSKLMKSATTAMGREASSLAQAILKLDHQAVDLFALFAGVDHQTKSSIERLVRTKKSNQSNVRDELRTLNRRLTELEKTGLTRT